MHELEGNQKPTQTPRPSSLVHASEQLIDEETKLTDDLKTAQQSTIEDIGFQAYIMSKALCFLCNYPPESIDAKFQKVNDTFLDESKIVLDNKVQNFIKTNINVSFFGKTSKSLAEEDQHVVLQMLVLIVVGKSEKLPLTTKLVFDNVKLIEHKKQFLENCFTSDDGATDLINCILFQVQGLRLNDDDIKEEVCNCNDEKHQLLVEWVSNLFEVKDEVKYRSSFKSLAVAFLTVHRYKENVIADCVQRQDEFRKDGRRYRAPILESLTTLLPVTSRFGTLTSWLSFAVILTLLSSLFYLGDFGSDVFLGLEYRPSYNITTCPFNSTDACENFLSLEWHHLHRETYLRHLASQCPANVATANNSTATSSGVYTDEFEIWNGQPYLVTGKNNTNICLGYLRAVNMWSAHNWTFIIICVTVMYHYFLLFYYPKTYDPMIRFYLGWCCGSNLSRCDEIKFYATKVVMGIISPYLTILYNNILMPATLHQISTNRKKIVTIRETLSSNNTLHDNSFFPQYPIKDKQNHFCTPNVNRVIVKNVVPK